MWHTALVLALTLQGCALGSAETDTQLQASTPLLPVSYTSADGDTAVDRSALKAAECDAVREQLRFSAQVMANARARAAKEAAAPPPTLFRAFERAWGSPDISTVAHEQYEREHRRATGLNARLVANGCPPIDIDAQVAATKPEPETTASTTTSSTSAASTSASSTTTTIDDAWRRRANDPLAQ